MTPDAELGSHSGGNISDPFSPTVYVDAYLSFSA